MDLRDAVEDNGPTESGDAAAEHAPAGTGDSQAQKNKASLRQSSKASQIQSPYICRPWRGNAAILDALSAAFPAAYGTDSPLTETERLILRRLLGECLIGALDPDAKLVMAGTRIAAIRDRKQTGHHEQIEGTITWASDQLGLRTTFVEYAPGQKWDRQRHGAMRIQVDYPAAFLDAWTGALKGQRTADYDLIAAKRLTLKEQGHRMQARCGSLRKAIPGARFRIF